MQATQPGTIKDKITKAAKEYLARADQWDTVGIIEQHTELLMDFFFDLLKLKPRKVKGDREPQSELEESKDKLEVFEQAIIQEMRKFVEGLKNSKIVAEADLDDLKSLRTMQRNQIAILGKFKEKCQGDI
jgi:hypothetical protein